MKICPNFYLDRKCWLVEFQPKKRIRNFYENVFQNPGLFDSRRSIRIYTLQIHAKNIEGRYLWGSIDWRTFKKQSMIKQNTVRWEVAWLQWGQRGQGCCLWGSVWLKIIQKRSRNEPGTASSVGKGLVSLLDTLGSVWYLGTIWDLLELLLYPYVSIKSWHTRGVLIAWFRAKRYLHTPARGVRGV